MGWLVFSFLLGLAIGMLFCVSQKTLRLLDRSLVASLVVMLVGLGIQVGQNPKLSQALDNHAFTVFALLLNTSLVSLLWGWLLERGWSSLWQRG